VRCAQAAAHDGEVLGIDIDQPAVNRAPTSHHAVGQPALVAHADPAGLIGHEGIYLAEGTRVEQQFDPLAGGEFAFGVLCLDALLTASHQALRTQFAQLLKARVN